jgi:hypothetical protein
MKIRALIAFLLCAVIVACGSQRETAQRSTTTDAPSRAAVWRADDDANLAWASCPNCGAVVGRDATACSNCGQAVHVEAKTIACPECHGSKVCTHCGPARECATCNGTHVCGICEGTGQWHGEVCPSCEGSKVCQDCIVGAKVEPCERCAETHVCANCNGTGEIVLR